MDAATIEQARAAVEKLKADPSLAHTPELSFFKEFIESWGGAVPKVQEKKKEEPKKDEPKKEETNKEEPKEEKEEVPEEPQEPDEPEIPADSEEEADPEQVPEDTEPFPEKSPGNELELSDEQMDKQGEIKQAATEALEDGDLAKALEKYTEAFKIGNVSAMMYAKRGELLLKLNRPCACIADCDAALEVNPDSAKAFRTRGKAHRKLGHWEQANRDISEAQKIDFDDGMCDVQDFVAKRWKKLSEYQNKVKARQDRIDKKKKEADMKKRKAQAQKDYEEYDRKQQAEHAEQGGGYGGGMPGGMGGMPGGMGGMPGGMGGMGGMPGGGGMPAGFDPSMFASMFGGKGGDGGGGGMPAGFDPSMFAGMMGGKGGGGGGMPGGIDPSMFAGMMGGKGGGMGGKGPAAAEPEEGAGPTFEEVDD